MTALPPLDVEVNARKWSCILDIHLALSRYGLIFALRLAEEMNVWLLPALWEILDSDQYYRDHPDRLSPDSLIGENSMESERREQILEALGQWQTARLEANLAALPFYWSGDGNHDSLLPKGMDYSLVQRFVTLSATLDRQRASNVNKLHPGYPFLECSRDAVALTAALARHRPILFTLTSADENREEPYLCTYLRENGIGCKKIDLETAANGKQVKEYISRIFARCGISELLWSGMELAAVHIISAKSYLMPMTNPEEPLYVTRPSLTDEKEVDLQIRENWWAETMAFWYDFG